MVNFAAIYFSGIVAATDPSYSQLVGISSPGFWSNVTLVAYDPLDSTVPIRPYDFFLVNNLGIGGIPDIPPQLISSITQKVNSSTILYSNGESFIISNTP
jgi:hypothetical protein